jgi:hypothetical protein
VAFDNELNNFVNILSHEKNEAAIIPGQCGTIIACKSGMYCAYASELSVINQQYKSGFLTNPYNM